MSSSPSICASPNFTFPAPSKMASYKSGDKLEPRVIEDHMDYFTHPKVKYSSHNSSTHHKSINDSVSSLSSNTSDSTLFDSHNPGKTSKRTDSIISAETLVEEVESPQIKYPVSSSHRNSMNLRLNFSKHKQNQSFSSTKEFRSLNQNEILNEFEDEFKAASALEPRFNFGDSNVTPNLVKLKSSESLPSSATVATSTFLFPSGGFATPCLRKQATLPALQSKMELSMHSIKGEQMKRFQPFASLNFKEALLKLSPVVKYISIDEAHMLMKESVSVNNLPNLLTIDIRSFTDYFKGHIKGSLNVSLPLTLLKRQNYNLTKCVSSLPQYEKVVIKSFILNNEVGNSNNGNEKNEQINEKVIKDNEQKIKNKSILLYESIDNSAALFHFCKKFTDCDPWNINIYILESGFANFQEKFKDDVESGNTQSIDINMLTECSGKSPVTTQRHSLDTSSDFTLTSPLDTKFDCVSTPVISNFSLPALPKSTFKIRHNEEVLSNDDSSIQSAIKLTQKYHDSELPKWIKHTVDSSAKLNKDFSLLEQYEKERLLNALSLKREENEENEKDKENTPVICSGIEFGHKNRYKDIFLYEHSRVKLQQCTNEPSYDYINASYINPSYDLDTLVKNTQAILPHVRYIASQGPLTETIGDFWKCIINHNIPLVISLTEEYENGVGKCSPYWIPGTYSSGINNIKVKCLEEEMIIENFLIRLFEVQMDNQNPKIVLQLHQLGWPDMGSVLHPDDILRVIILKRSIIKYVFDKTSIDYPTLIHCSAGCGRTGTLCTIDSIINIMIANELVDLPFDPVYPIVDGLRKQRISMVQNLRQYFLIYDTLLHYLSNYKNTKWDELLNSSIINDFMKKYMK